MKPGLHRRSMLFLGPSLALVAIGNTAPNTLEFSTSNGNRARITVPDTVPDPAGARVLYLVRWPRRFINPPDQPIVVSPSIVARPASSWVYNGTEPTDLQKTFTGDPSDGLSFRLLFETRARTPTGEPDGRDEPEVIIRMPLVNLSFTAPRGYILADNEEAQAPGGIVPGTGVHSLLGGESKPSLVPVEVRAIEPSSLAGEYFFHWDQQRYRLWRDMDRTAAVQPGTGNPATQSYTFYFEALVGSSAAGDGQLRVDWASPNNRMEGAALLRLTAPQVRIKGHAPGTLSSSGSVLTVPARDDSNEILCAIVLPINEDGDEAPAGAANPPPDNANSTAGPQDDDLVKLTLELAPPDLALGTIEVKLPYSVRAFKQDGQEIQSSDLKVNLRAPSGPLANLASGSVDIWVETMPGYAQGIVSPKSMQLTVTYDGKDITSVEESTPSSTDQLRLAVLLLPIEMKLLWETENKANQIYNPTKKDDPWYYEGFGSTGGSNNGASRNRLFLVPDPQDNKYKATLEVEMPEEFRTKFLAAAYVIDTKVANSDKAFDAEGKCELEFEHLGTSEDIQDFAVRIGYDANNSGTLDPEEITKLAVKNFGEPLIRGTRGSKYDSAKGNIDNVVNGFGIGGNWLAPHARNFLRIFRDGNAGGVPSDKQPASPPTDTSLDAFGGYFSEWLTHNSGATFSDEGVAAIKEYVWGDQTSSANLIATSPQIQDAVRSYYNSAVLPLVVAHFASLPVGSSAYFPSTSFYDIPHTHESPAWVPVTTITFDSLLPNQVDDLNGTIGRGRLLSHKARYKIEKREITEWVQDCYVTYTAIVPTEVTSLGVVIDLYDFNHMVGGFAQDAAILQIGFRKGAYGGPRDRGKVYQGRIEFNKIYPSLP